MSLSADGVKPRPHWAHIMESLRAIGSPELGPPLVPRRAPHPRERNHLQHLRRPAGPTALGNRPHPLLSFPLKSGASSRPASIQRAQLLSLHPRRPLRLPRISQRRRSRSPPPCSTPTPLSCVHWSASKFRPQLPAHARRRSRPLAGRPVVGARRPHPGPVWQRLRTRKPHHRLRPTARAFPHLKRPPSRALLPRPARSTHRLAKKDNPRIVLLTPGPHNETYFEHSYLAKYLGFTLVEGSDLTVRDRSVFLKTVAASSRSTSSCAVSTTASATRSNFAATRSSVSPAWSTPSSPATSRSPMRWAAD